MKRLFLALVLTLIPITFTGGTAPVWLGGNTNTASISGSGCLAWSLATAGGNGSRITPSVKVARQIKPAIVAVYEDGRVIGSAFVVSKDGYIATCAHCVDPSAKTVKLRLFGGADVQAKVATHCAANDCCILKIDPGVDADGKAVEMVFVALPAIDDVLVGETVIAAGHPFGLHNSFTTGTVTALNRTITIDGTTTTGMVQTDTAINPGNSGGPLVNVNGELVGINAAGTRGANCVGFAVNAMVVVDCLKTARRAMGENDGR